MNKTFNNYYKKMKGILLLICLLMAAIAVKATDVIVLKDGQTINCNLVEIDITTVTVELIEKPELLTIDRVDIMFLDIDKKNKRAIKQLKKEFKRIRAEENEDPCMRGKEDARLMHRRGGGNFALGFFFGVFGVAGTALGKPYPPQMYHLNEPYFNDPIYRQCYDRKAKGKNVINASIGLGTWAALLLVGYLSSQ